VISKPIFCYTEICEGNTMNNIDDTTATTLKGLSSQDFLTFGIHDIAYVRKIDTQGQEGFAIHAADGTPLSVMDTMDEAIQLIEHNDLASAHVH